jgi:hypothetical protein
MSNWDKVNSLLSVIHSAAGAGPKFTKWAQKASDELEQHWAESAPADEPNPPTPPTPQSEPDEPADDATPTVRRL